MTIFSYSSGDILRTNTAAIVNPVNCVGVMGKGLALQFKRKYPAMFDAYKKICKARHLSPGCILVWDNSKYHASGPKFVFNLSTKDDWKSRSKLEYVRSGVGYIRDYITSKPIPSISIPALGCGLGGLDWCNVEPIIRENLEGIDGLDVILFPPK